MAYHKCPVEDCVEQVPRNVYACKHHWFSLPKEIREQILIGYRSSAKIWLEADKAAREFWEKGKFLL